VAKDTRYARGFLGTFGFNHAVAAPLAGPVFAGYGGVVQLLRTEEQGEFSDAEIRKLRDNVAAAGPDDQHHAHIANDGSRCGLGMAGDAGGATVHILTAMRKYGF